MHDVPRKKNPSKEAVMIQTPSLPNVHHPPYNGKFDPRKHSLYRPYVIILCCDCARDSQELVQATVSFTGTVSSLRSFGVRRCFSFRELGTGCYTVRCGGILDIIWHKVRSQARSVQPITKETKRHVI